MSSMMFAAHRTEGDAENARPENDGQRKLWVWIMQDWKMTDNIFSKLWTKLRGLENAGLENDGQNSSKL